LQQEIAALFKLTSALETAEQEEKALWQQHDIIRVNLERDKWKIPFDYSNQLFLLVNYAKMSKLQYQASVKQQE